MEDLPGNNRNFISKSVFKYFYLEYKREEEKRLVVYSSSMEGRNGINVKHSYITRTRLVERS